MLSVSELFFFYVYHALDNDLWVTVKSVYSLFCSVSTMLWKFLDGITRAVIYLWILKCQSMMK